MFSSISKEILAYTQNSARDMTRFIKKNQSEYFRLPKIAIKHDISTGCLTGIKTYRGNPVAYIEICSPHIISYTQNGFPEYKHIEHDHEIGNLDFPCHWKQTLVTVLCHEMAHAVVMYTATLKNEIVVPETYHAYSVDLMDSKYEEQKKFHGKRWQFVYRKLRNEFVNAKPDQYWY